MDNRFDPGRVMEVIGEIGPDVIALQEATQRFGDDTYRTLELRTGSGPLCNSNTVAAATKLEGKIVRAGNV